VSFERCQDRLWQFYSARLLRFRALELQHLPGLRARGSLSKPMQSVKEVALL
jgi:hypothetical protein